MIKKVRSPLKVKKGIHQVYGINGTLAVLRNNKYQIQSIEVLEKKFCIKE